MSKISFECTIDGVKYFNCAVFPFNFEDALDATLDNAALTLERVRKEVFEPLTLLTVTVKSGGDSGEEEYATDWLIQTDAAEEAPVGSGLYRHTLSLIEPTKYLEGFIADSVCVTHPGGNVYTNNAKPVDPVET